MQMTFDRQERQQQRYQLRARYPDYDPKYHDVFVERWNREMDKQALTAYEAARGITKPETTP